MKEKGIREAVVLRMSDVAPRTDAARRAKNDLGLQHWRFDKKANCLVFVPKKPLEYEYEIDLDRCKSAGEALDWLFHVSRKTWSTHEVTGELVEAFRICAKVKMDSSA